MARLITARVPFAGTINVTYLVDDDADDDALVDGAYQTAIDTLNHVEWPYYDGADGATGDFGTVEVYGNLLSGDALRADCTEIEIDADEDDGELR